MIKLLFIFNFIVYYLKNRLRAINFILEDSELFLFNFQSLLQDFITFRTFIFHKLTNSYDNEQIINLMKINKTKSKNYLRRIIVNSQITVLMKKLKNLTFFKLLVFQIIFFVLHNYQINSFLKRLLRQGIIRAFTITVEMKLWKTLKTQKDNDRLGGNPAQLKTKLRDNINNFQNGSDVNIKFTDLSPSPFKQSLDTPKFQPIVKNKIAINNGLTNANNEQLAGVNSSIPNERTNYSDQNFVFTENNLFAQYNSRVILTNLYYLTKQIKQIKICRQEIFAEISHFSNNLPKLIKQVSNKIEKRCSQIYKSRIKKNQQKYEKLEEDYMQSLVQSQQLKEKNELQKNTIQHLSNKLQLWNEVQVQLINQNLGLKETIANLKKQLPKQKEKEHKEEKKKYYDQIQILKQQLLCMQKKQIMSEKQQNNVKCEQQQNIKQRQATLIQKQAELQKNYLSFQSIILETDNRLTQIKQKQQYFNNQELHLSELEHVILDQSSLINKLKQQIKIINDEKMLHEQSLKNSPIYEYKEPLYKLNFINNNAHSSITSTRNFPTQQQLLMQSNETLRNQQYRQNKLHKTKSMERINPQNMFNTVSSTSIRSVPPRQLLKQNYKIPEPTKMRQLQNKLNKLRKEIKQEISQAY